MPSRSTNSSNSLANLRQRKYILIAEEIPIALQFVVSARNCPPGDCDTISRRRLPPSACKVMLGLRARSVRANAAVWTSPETSPAISMRAALASSTPARSKSPPMSTRSFRSTLIPNVVK